MTKPLLCPICKKPVDLASEDVPFCSERCRLIDLGKWASGDYKISSPALDPDLLEEIEEAELRAQRRREDEH
ncbi:MAG TPA: DNA gyrase inhibitor YacG [Acidobacteriaceae bacterium]|nr:DNA gyrase inhibitor YacG [Acidobacteriaceae bacterium]